MSESAEAAYIYNATMKMFGTAAEPAFESESEQTAGWGRRWGCDNDVGRLRVVLMHRPGPELGVVDPSKRIEEIGSFGDVEAGWYWQSDTIPPVAAMQSQHDAFVAALREEGVEIVFMDGETAGRLKSCYTRDPVIAVKGGAIVCRMAPRVRRGEELNATRTLARIGMPVLRTLNGTAMMEGGSFAWINSRTAVIGRSIRCNNEGAAQVAEVLRWQGVETLMVDLCGYLIHIDGAFLMIDRDLALVDPSQLPYWFLEKLKALGIETIEITPADNGWIVNALAIAPGRVIMPEGASNRTLDQLARRNVSLRIVPYDKMQLNGGGLHCSTSPLVRDSLD
ncbi:MAG: arginine deiminase family protein [Hyphomicrobiaceae bacterium]